MRNHKYTAICTLLFLVGAAMLAIHTPFGAFILGLAIGGLINIIEDN